MGRRFSIKTVAITAAMVLAIAAVLWLWSGRGRSTLSLVDLETGRPYLTVPVQEGEVFAVSFLHSVNKSLITERYTIESDGIYLEECLFSSYGAGVASSLEEGQQLLYLDNGLMLLTGIHRRLPDLNYRVGRVTDHILEIGDLQYSLTELCGQNASVRFLLS